MKPGDLVETTAEVDPFFLRSIPCTLDGWKSWEYIDLVEGLKGVVLHPSEKKEGCWPTELKVEFPVEALVGGKVHLFLFSIDQLRKIQ